MIMELEFVDFELAKKLNGLGFPVDYSAPIYCINECKRDEGDYFTTHKVGDYNFDAYGFEDKDIIACPTLELAAKWLREIQDIEIDIDVTHIFATANHKGYIWKIKKVDKEKCELVDIKSFELIESSYENALKTAIIESVNLLSDGDN